MKTITLEAGQCLLINQLFTLIYSMYIDVITY